MPEEPAARKNYEGKARIGRVMKNIAMVNLRPEDLTNPISFQMAMTRIYESIMRIFEEGGPRQTYIAEVRFTDDLGNQVVFAVDLGETPPPLSKDKVRARVVVEIYDEEPED
ncbi:MAG: hypothetical protein LRS49_01860 [Desulfurococcales archaeon]|nr:hypothetical protein [Desulfurococcales archaeon]